MRYSADTGVRGRRVPRTKIAVPRVPANAVPRPGLRQALNDLVAAYPVTLICAPAGYGKTVLLADWVAVARANDDARVAWVSLNASDDDPGRFWAALGAALSAAIGDRPGGGVLPDSAAAAVDPAGFVAELSDALATVGEPTWLVLDDVHEVTAAHTLVAIAGLIRHLPDSVRLVLSSRADPPLPIARLRLAGRLGELRADRLRFTTAEADELLHRTEVQLDDGQLDRLLHQTDGWPAGLRLAAQSLRWAGDRDRFLAEFAGTDRAIADFLVGEVLDRLAPDTRELLRRVSVCEQISPELATALSGRDDAGAVLAGLEHDNALVLGGGTGRRWFRMHPLLRSYLYADLARDGAARLTELHTLAAEWFADRELPVAAFAHVVRVTEPGPLASLLRRHAVPLLLAGGDHDSVRRTLARLGPPAEADPGIALVSALAAAVDGDLPAADAALARTRALWPANGHAVGDDIGALRELVVLVTDLARGRRSRFRAPAGADDRAAAWHRFAAGWSALAAGDGVRAGHDLLAADRVADEHGFAFLALHTRSALGLLAASTGDLAAAVTPCEQAVAIAAAHRWEHSPWLAADLALLGLTDLLRLNPTAAVDHAWAAVAALGGFDAPLPRYAAELVLAAAAFDTGHHHDGLRRMRRARAQLAGAGLPIGLALAGAMLEHQAAITVDQPEAARQVLAWAGGRGTRQVGANPVSTVSTVSTVGNVNAGTAEIAVMRAWAALRAGDLAAAEGTIRAGPDDPADARVPTTPVESALVEAAVALRRGRRSKARDTLAAALAAAEPAGLIRPFRYADEPVRELLREQVGGFGRTNDFAAAVSHAVSTADAQPDGRLTDRERAVLGLLAEPRSLDELAVDLEVSVNTVKTHVRAIYAKLGVNSRRAAVVVARQRGLE